MESPDRTIAVDVGPDECQVVVCHAHDAKPEQIALAVARAVSQAWQQKLDAYADKLHAKWEAFSIEADAMNEVEPNEDDGPQFVASFDELVRLGVRFDPSFAARVNSWKPRGDIDNSRLASGSAESFIEDHEEAPTQPLADRKKRKRRKSEQMERDIHAAHLRRVHAHAQRVAKIGLSLADHSHKGGRRTKPVWCVELKRRFPSGSDAAMFVKRSPANIVQAMKTGGLCGGYHWERYSRRKHGPAA